MCANINCTFACSIAHWIRARNLFRVPERYCASRLEYASLYATEVRQHLRMLLIYLLEYSGNQGRADVQLRTFQWLPVNYCIVLMITLSMSLNMLSASRLYSAFFVFIGPKCFRLVRSITVTYSVANEGHSFVSL